ncbi:MAG: DMT family transporter [Aliarcobacter sp.]|nr:DMT family transporter [Aliarcobacter sp.]
MKNNISSFIDLKLFFIAFITLIGLSLNSIFCKFALINNHTDPYSFTFLRLFFASITLILIVIYKRKRVKINLKANWISSFMLFLYAITFSYSYLNLDAGLGTLLLFAVVQIMMIVFSLFYKEKINLQKIFGMLLALIGLVYLLYPKENFEVSLFHAFLMIIAGFAWGIYTVLGKKSSDSLHNTMDNFTKALVFVILFYLLYLPNNLFLDKTGILIAFISGSLTSGIAYMLLYEILPKIQFITAGVIQLLIPILSIIISIIFLDEILTSTLIISSVLICLGIVLTIKNKTK